MAAVTVAALCVGLPPALASAQTPEPTPPGPYQQGQCGELAPEPSPAFAVPTNLTVRWGPLPDNPQASGALLAWQDNADNETCYVVQRNGPAATDWQEILLAPSTNWEDADDRNFEAPGYYCYRVFAGSEAGRSAYSNEACLEVPEATVHGLPPGAPPPGPPPTPPAAAVSPAVAATPAALPPTGGGSPAGSGAPLHLPMAILLAAVGVLASAGLLALARRRR
jgi:hypothetical protein